MRQRVNLSMFLDAQVGKSNGNQPSLGEAGPRSLDIYRREASTSFFALVNIIHPRVPILSCVLVIRAERTRFRSHPPSHHRPSILPFRHPTISSGQQTTFQPPLQTMPSSISSSLLPLLLTLLLTLTPHPTTASQCTKTGIPYYANVYNDIWAMRTALCSGQGASCTSSDGINGCSASSGNVKGGYAAAGSGVPGECWVSTTLRCLAEMRDVIYRCRSSQGVWLVEGRLT